MWYCTYRTHHTGLTCTINLHTFIYITL
ncbi:hypothetical protein V496_04646, partial [Pseudogymnoascus sp. VKM F-4515 (FW-2607)]